MQPYPTFYISPRDLSLGLHAFIESSPTLSATSLACLPIFLGKMSVYFPSLKLVVLLLLSYRNFFFVTCEGLGIYLSNSVSSLCKAMGSIPSSLEKEKRESFKNILATNFLSDI